jgi:DNA polymerase I-like protein with 3'-5' exonuclease and polymerase domains
MRGKPKLLWRPAGKKAAKKEEQYLFNPNPDGTYGGGLNKQEEASEGTSKVLRKPVDTAEDLNAIIEAVGPADRVALDLETMPPEGWVREVVGAYRKWRRFNPQGNPRKAEPKEEAKRKKWNEIKENTYKKGATDVAGARVRLVSLATDDGLNVVVDATEVGIQDLLEALKVKTLVTHNGGFDLGVLRSRYGYVHGGRVLDTQRLYILHHHAEDGSRTEISGGKWRLPDPTKVKGMTALGTLAKKYLELELDKGDQRSDWSLPMLSASQVAYALEDSRVLLDLSRVLVDRLTGLGMARIVDLESRAFPARVDMELNGFPADAAVAERMADRYLAESEAALDRADALLPQAEAPDGEPWNWNKAGHIRTVLRMLGADIDREDYPMTGKTGEPSTAKEALTTIEKPERAVSWVGAYLEYLSVHKLHNDFASKYGALIRGGAIRGRFGETSTGRYWCEKPNLQQVPARGEAQTLEGMRIRDIFRPPDGEAFVVADFKQVELLLAATIAVRETGLDPNMLNVFRDGDKDIHTETAATVLKKPASEISKAERTLAKALNFGLVYGAKAETLLESARNGYGVTEMTLKDARKYRKAFFERYPELAAWHERVEDRCKAREECSVTPMGRRRKLPTWDSSGPKGKAIASTAAKNSPVQGAGADAIKLTMARLFEDRRNCPGNPILRCTIHDEVVLSVGKEHAEAAAAWVGEHMAAAEREAVGDPESPIVTDIEIRDRW